jgi:hypothetical protein
MSLVFEVVDTMPEYNEGDKINADMTILEKEIAQGLHNVTGRPMSALLNHCRLIDGPEEAHKAISDLMEGANEAVDPTIAAVDSARAVADGEEYERKGLTENETRAKAKEMGINNWHNMGIDKLKARIAEAAEG